VTGFSHEGDELLLEELLLLDPPLLSELPEPPLLELELLELTRSSMNCCWKRGCC
jgi:hypothetical protein